MSTPSRRSRRKPPSQERSRVTVDAILEATARVLVSDGFAGASTNKIAQTAGVSVGTLYQYYPSKESLVAELIDRGADEMMGVMVSNMAALAGEPLEKVVPAVTKAVIAVFAEKAELNRELFLQWQSVGRLYKLRENEARAAQIIKLYLEQHRDKVRPKNLAIASLLLVHLTDTMANIFTTLHPTILRDPEFAEEMADLVSRYVLK
jgi:AcrR family transcriptional regulator